MSLAEKKIDWKSQRDGYIEAIRYLEGRKNGKIKSFKTPWTKVNDAGVDGWEWHSMIVIGGRPGTGKTLLKDQIVREAFALNPQEKEMRVLEFQFEMLQRASAVREFSSVLGKPYKYVCSAGKDENGNKFELTQEDLKKCSMYARDRVTHPIDIVEDKCTVEQFKATVERYMKQHSRKVRKKFERFKKDLDGNPMLDARGEKIKETYEKDVIEYKNTIVTIDHSYLLDQGKGNKTDMLYHLGDACTDLKRKYPIILIVLSQLKREAESADRNQDGKYGNYILETDILGGDALMQHADMVIGLNRPAMKFIKFYGPDKFIIEDEKTLVMHFLKCRNGDVRMSFFRAAYHKMQIEEMNTPGRQEKRIQTQVD